MTVCAAISTIALQIISPKAKLIAGFMLNGSGQCIWNKQDGVNVDHSALCRATGGTLAKRSLFNCSTSILMWY